MNQSLYFDFTHDVKIAAVVTAFGLTHLNQSLTASGPPANQQMIVEVVTAPQPVKAARPATNNQTMANYYEAGNTTS